jgi:hypothetical protein
MTLTFTPKVDVPMRISAYGKTTRISMLSDESGGLHERQHGPGPPARLSALSVFHSKSVFVWRFCMGAQGA